MSVKVTYKGEELLNIDSTATKTLTTKQKYLEDDITLEHVQSGGTEPVITPLSVTENGTYTAPTGTDGYSPVTVNVPTGGDLPAIISKIDGGTFTLGADTLTGTHEILHSLGERPKGFYIWAVNVSKTSYAVRTVNMYSANEYDGTLTQVNTNGTDRAVVATLPATGDLTAESFKFTVSSNYYKAGQRYNWLAWA